MLFSSAALDQLQDDFSAKFEEHLVHHSQDAGTKVVIIVESLTAGSVLVKFSASFYTEGNEVAQVDAAQQAANKLETDLETNCSAIFRGDPYFDQYGEAELASDVTTTQSGYLITTNTSKSSSTESVRDDASTKSPTGGSDHESISKSSHNGFKRLAITLVAMYIACPFAFM